MNRRTMMIAVPLLVLVAIVVVACVWNAMHPSGQLQNASQAPIAAKLAVGGPAPEFAIPTTDGFFDLNAAKKPVFLEVFATWCPHCQRETAVLNMLYTNYKDKIDFVAVSGSETGMDGAAPSSENDVLNFRQQFNVKYPVAYDGQLTVAHLYLQSGFPTVVVIGTKKNVDYVKSGEIGYPELAAALDNALK